MDIERFLATVLEDGHPSASIAETWKELKAFSREFAGTGFLDTTALFGGLLTVPELQANCTRLEVLSHLAVAFARGSRVPTVEQIAPWFEMLGRGVCGHLEDPAEDVFVSLVSDASGSYRLFEGIWESNAFHVERFLDVIESMPDGEPFVSLKRNVTALLRLSDLVAQRSSLDRNTLGGISPLSTIPDSLNGASDVIRRRVTFTMSEMINLGIVPSDLEPFVHGTASRSKVRKQVMGHTTLEQRPIIRWGDYYVLALPTAIGAAIRRIVIEGSLAAGHGRQLHHALAAVYADLFAEVSILGQHRGAPLYFVPAGKLLVAERVVSVDEGRYLHLVFFLDSFENYSVRGLFGTGRDTALTTRLEASVASARRQFAARPGFRQGVTLVVACGWGRGFTAAIPKGDPPTWRVEVISDANLVTLGGAPSLTPLTLFRVLDARDSLEREGIHLQNANGLLNLVAWARSLKGHLVPHERLPDEFGGPEQHAMLLIEQNALLGLRAEVANGWDRHRVEDVTGVRVAVARERPFGEISTAQSTLYVSLDDIKKKRLRAVIETSMRSWWIGIETPRDMDRDTVYHLWLATARWAERVVPPLERALPSYPLGAVEWVVSFADSNVEHNSDEPPNFSDLRPLASISADRGGRSMRLGLAAGFLQGFRNPKNVAERVIVDGLVRVASLYADAPLDVDAIVADVMPNEGARSFHAFEARGFREVVRDTLPKAQVIDQFDDAASRIGLGWLARSRTEGAHIVGVAECTAFLNETVAAVWERLKSLLKTLDRMETVRRLILNWEASAAEAAHWRRTIKALYSLHADRVAVDAVAVDRLGRLTAAELASRLAAEMAICECPLTGGGVPGAIELGRLMTDAMLTFAKGGYSDAIKYQAMPAEIRVSSAGDILMQHDFTDNVVEAYGRQFQTTRLADDERRYVESYAPLDLVESAEAHFEEEFLAAWRAEFGIGIDQLRLLMDLTENRGVELGTAVYSLRRSELEALVDAEKLTPSLLKQFLDRFTLGPRASFVQTPEGFLRKAWYPWRFRRQLSLVSRPIIRIDDEPDPTLLIAPGMVREGIIYVLGGTHKAWFDGDYFTTDLMRRRWIGPRRNASGHAFNERAAQRIRDLGWQARSNVKMTQILNRPLDRDYGDVDVLAWRDDDPRVFCIECKELAMDKTLGEIAERLFEYRGEDDRNGKPDRLKKHMLRAALLSAESSAVQGFLRRTATLEIRPVLVFDNPTPMNFHASEALARTRVATFATIGDVLRASE